MVILSYIKEITFKNKIYKYDSFAFCTKQITPTLYGEFKSEALIFKIENSRLIFTASIEGFINNLMEFLIVNGKVDFDSIENLIMHLSSTLITDIDATFFGTAYIVDADSFSLDDELLYIDVTDTDWLDISHKNDIYYSLFVSCNVMLARKKATFYLRSREVPSKFNIAYGTLEVSPFDVMMVIADKLYNFSTPSQLATYKLWEHLLTESYKSDFKNSYEIENSAKKVHYIYQAIH